MTGTKLGNAYREYATTNKGIVEWIIGLTIAEIALVISQNSFIASWQIIILLVVGLFSIVVGTIMMYVIIANADIELFSAIIWAKDPEMKEEEFDQKYNKRFKGLSRFFTELMLDKKLYNYLFISFFLQSSWAVYLLVTCFNR